MARGSIQQSGSVRPVEGNITFIFTDSNGVEVRKTVGLEFYDHNSE